MNTTRNTKDNTTLVQENFTKSFILIVPNEKKIKYGIYSYGIKIKSVEIIIGYNSVRGSSPMLTAKEVRDAGKAENIAVGVNMKLTTTPNTAVTNAAPTPPTELKSGDR